MRYESLGGKKLLFSDRALNFRHTAANFDPTKAIVADRKLNFASKFA